MKRPVTSTVLRGLAWGLAIAVTLYAVALWLLLRPLASSVADGWVDAVNGEPAGVPEEPDAAPDAATATADERIRRAFANLSARVSPDDVRRNIAEADDEVWLETAWSALNALEDFSKETGCQPGRGEYHPETAVFAMADGAIWTNGLDYALNGTPREALNLRWFVLLNQLVQKVGHFDGETLDVRLRGEGSHFDEPLVATIWHGLAKAGWWLDWDHRRLVLRISRPAGTPEEEDASAADFAAFLACAHFFHDDPARIPGESEVAERLANLLASSWKRLRTNGWTVKPAGFENWRRVPDSDAPPPAIVLKAAMWDDLRCYPSDEEPAIRRSEALEFLSFLRPAQLSALLAGPRDDPRRGFVLRALGLAHAFGCAPEWDGKDWTDAADRFALDDAARVEPARALLFQSDLFAPYRDEIERAGAEFPFRFRPEPPKPPSVGVSDIGPDPRAAELLFEGDAAISPEDRRRIEIRPPVVRRKPDR